MKRSFILGVSAMAVVLAISNYLVQYQLGDWLTWAAFTYPLAFLITDCVNRAAGVRIAARVVSFGFFFGVPLSYLFILSGGGDWLTALRLSAASGIAFVVAQSVDIALFSRLRQAKWWMPPAVSSSLSSVLDAFLFFSIAFIGSDVPWLTLAIGDLVIKALMVAVLLLPYRLFIIRWSPA